MPPALESVAAPSAVLPVVVMVDGPERAAEQVLEVTIVVVAAAAAAAGGEVARYSTKPSLQHLQYHYIHQYHT